MYIRGVKGLRQARKNIVGTKAGNLDYLGEWHSHPKGASTKPSDDDRTVFQWISDLLAVEGRPPVMLIVADASVTLVLTGVMFMTGAMQTFSYWLLETFPGLGKLG